MSSDTDTDRYERLNEDLRLVKERYKDLTVLYIFENSDNTVMAVLLPTFDSLVCGNVINSVLYNNNRRIECFDIRLFLDTEIHSPLYNFIFGLKSSYGIIPNVADGQPHDLLEAIVKDKEFNPIFVVEQLKKILYKHLMADNKTANFFRHLSDAEKLVLNCLLNNYGAEGTITQAKVATLAGVPKATVAKLISKMESYKIATILNCGPKGTYYKITDEQLLISS